jgi:hypothetical protein
LDLEKSGNPALDAAMVDFSLSLELLFRRKTSPLFQSIENKLPTTVLFIKFGNAQTTRTIKIDRVKKIKTSSGLFDSLVGLLLKFKTNKRIIESQLINKHAIRQNNKAHSKKIRHFETQKHQNENIRFI